MKLLNMELSKNIHTESSTPMTFEESLQRKTEQLVFSPSHYWLMRSKHYNPFKYSTVWQMLTKTLIISHRTFEKFRMHWNRPNCSILSISNLRLKSARNWIWCRPYKHRFITSNSILFYQMHELIDLSFWGSL